MKELLQQNMNIRLQPKDPDPYPNFRIEKISENEIEFHKLSSSQRLTVETRKVAEITVSPEERLAYIRLLGRVSWDSGSQQWRFTAPVVGRPSLAGELVR